MSDERRLLGNVYAGEWVEPVKLLRLPLVPNPELVRRSLEAARRAVAGANEIDHASPLWAKHGPPDEAARQIDGVKARW